jgi:hypothetical protein
VSRRTAAAIVAAVAGLAAALMFLVVPAVASGGGSRAGTHGTVQAQVQRFVVRNDAGQVVARGATAWLSGHRPAATRTMTRGSTVRVATARRGHGVVVQHLKAGTGAPATASR